MKSVLRQRIPASVRALLTDIQPKSHLHWSDEEGQDPPAVYRDGISVPVRVTGAAISTTGVCGLCLAKPQAYTCPRCNVAYCGLACYRSPAHTHCSEQFYRECVCGELRGTDGQDRKRMQEILLRLSPILRGTEEMDDTCAGLFDGTEGNGEVLELLSRLAEIQSSSEEQDREELERIITRLRDIGEQDEDKDDEEDELVTRVSGLDLDSLSGKHLWALLPRQHQERFERLLQDGAIGELVPQWTPWWDRHEDSEPELDVPRVSTDIPSLSSICSRQPSPLVRYSLVNALYGYANVLHLHNGDVPRRDGLQEFCSVLLRVSGSLCSNRVFTCLAEALHRGDSDTDGGSVEGVAHILTGRSRQDTAGYALAALSHVRDILNRARRGVKEAGEEKRKLFNAGKKCEFLQAWVKQNQHELKDMAREVWAELIRWEKERETLEREKRGLEESWKKGKGRKKGALIEEVS